MTKKEKKDLIHYKYNLRECDEIDYLESIIAKTRHKAFNDFEFDIIRLLDLPLDYLIQK